MLDRFQTAAEAVGTTVKRFSTLERAAAYLHTVADGSATSRSRLPPEIAAACADMPHLPPERGAEARLCISFARAGIAETGSLLLEVTDPTERGATALSVIHAVFLRAADIVPSLADLAGELEQMLAAPGQAYLSITTGPSRTADIERVLTIGVHGAKELHVLIIEGA